MAHFDRDANGVPFSEWFTASKSVTYVGGTANGVGDFDGDSNPNTLFDVTGVVLVKIFGVCGTDLVGATATIEVGVDGGTATLLAQTTGTDLDAGDLWHDASPDAKVEASTVLSEKVVKDDIIETVGTANITAGEITYYVIWKPISQGASVVAR